jgi:hypothetical protein
MRRKLAVAVLSISSLAIPQFASAGQDRHHDSGYYQNSYSDNGRYYHRGGDDRDGYHGDRDGYRGDRGYYGGGYGDHYYYDRDHHAGRSAAIIGGSAVAGAAIGGAAGRGQGAAIGAVIGGVAGIVANQAVRHHDHDRRW